MGYRFPSKSGMMALMPLPVTSCLMAILMIPAIPPQNLTVSPSERHLAPVWVPAPSVSAVDSAFIESLRRDIAKHPADFLVFGSDSRADEFILSHTDALLETDRRVVQRGIKGYWQGKTLVVLPSGTN